MVVTKRPTESCYILLPSVMFNFLFLPFFSQNVYFFKINFRFSEAEKAKRHPYAFNPFGYGPRHCVGMRFALLEIKLTLVKVLKKFKLEKTDKMEVRVDGI